MRPRLAGHRRGEEGGLKKERIPSQLVNLYVAKFIEAVMKATSPEDAWERIRQFLVLPDPTATSEKERKQAIRDFATIVSAIQGFASDTLVNMANEKMITLAPYSRHGLSANNSGE